MNNLLKPQSESFFVPVGLSVLAQMMCAGLVTALVAFGYQAQNSHTTGADSVSSSAKTLPDAVEPAVANNAVASEAPATPGIAAPQEKESNARMSDVSAQPDVTAQAAATDEQPATTNSKPTPDAQPASGEQPPTGSANAGQPRPLDDVRTRSRLLPIAGEGVSETSDLCRIGIDDVSLVSLELPGAAFPERRALTLKIQSPVVKDGSCTWKVTQDAAAGFDRVQDLGEFRLKDHQFGFDWSKNADKGRLPFCKLRISAGADSEVCSLWTPVHSPALSLNFNNRTQRLSSFVPPGVSLPPADSLKLEITMEGWPEHQQEAEFLVDNKPVRLSFSDPESNRSLLWIVLTLKDENGQIGVDASFFTSVPQNASQRTKSVDDIRFEDKPLSHKDLEKFAKDIKKETARYQSEMDTIDAAIIKLQPRLDNLTQQLQRQFNPVVDAERDHLQASLNQLTEKQTTAQEFRDFYADGDAAAMALTELCDKLEKEARIHFRLIRLYNSGESVIASSVSVAL